ncbi:hypothetical protein D9M68_596980 [compost metagenome]
MPELFLAAGEDDFLAQQAQHLHSEGFIADDEVQAGLVRKRSGGHGLFVQRSNDGAVQALRHLGFRTIDAMLEQGQRAAHLVAGQFVRVADAHAQGGVGPRQFHEPAIQRGHGAALAADGFPGRRGQRGSIGMAVRHGMPAFARAPLGIVVGEGGDGGIQLGPGNEKTARGFVESVPRRAVDTGISA